MGTPLRLRSASANWTVIAVIGIGACAGAGVLFGQTALWGAVGAATVIYMGAIGIWMARRTPSAGAVAAADQLTIAPPAEPPPSPRPAPSPPGTAQLETSPADGTETGPATRLDIGSAEFADLIHALADQIDEPVDILDIAKLAGLRMALARTSGPQTALNLWTAILTRAVRDARVDRLIAEARRFGFETPVAAQ